ncbi:MAG: hypothetical protein ACRC33_10255, partial [Gemmataceae bacterium]
ANLFMRWAQFGCFTPILQMHRQVKKRQGDPDATALGQYPWGYGSEAEENYPTRLVWRAIAGERASSRRMWQPD